MVICLEQGADLHMAQLMPLPLTVSCFNKIQIGFTFLVPAHLGSPGKRAVKRVCVWCCVGKMCGGGINMQIHASQPDLRVNTCPWPDMDYTSTTLVLAAKIVFFPLEHRQTETQTNSEM